VKIAPVDWVIIVGYLVFALAVGVIFSRRAGRNIKEFFLSGRNLPWWLAGTSMVATSFAADTPLVITGWVRSHGIAFNWLWWSFAIGGMFSVFLLARLWRRAEIITDVELTELRYSGRSAAALRGVRAAYMAIPVNCITMAWVILAMIKVMGVLLDVDPLVAVAICIGLTTVYAVLSGFWGVVVTDLLQFALAMTGAVALCVLAVGGVGGLGELVAKAGQAEATGGQRLLDFFPRIPAGTHFWQIDFWTGPVFAFAVFCTVQWWANKNADGGGVIIQRMLAAKDEKSSLLATLWFNVANYAVRSWPWILVAVASVVVFPEAPQGDDELAYPMMMTRYLPPGLMGVMIASLLAAFMSTIDTHVNLSASYIVNDLYRRFVLPDASEQHYVAISRVASVCLVLLASGIALLAESISGLFTFLLAFTSGIGLVLIARWFWWRVSAWSELTAMLVSGVLAIGLSVAKKFLWPGQLAWMTSQHVLLYTVVGSTAAWVLVTFLTPPVAREKLVAFYRRVRPYGAWGPIAAAAGVPPARGLGGMLIRWLAGTVMVLGATISLGKFLLGSPWEGAGYLAAAVAGAAVVGVAICRLDRDQAGTDL